MNDRKIITTKKEKFSSRRLDVMLAAARVFARLGYHGASINDVAAELGITAAALYHYFSSKEDLYEECSRAVLFDLEGYLDKISEDKSLNGLGKIRSYFSYHANYITGDLGRCLILAGRLGEKSPSTERGSPSQILTDRVRTLVASAIHDGSVQPCNPIILSQMLFGSVNTIARWWEANKELSPGEAAETMIDMLTNGIAGINARQPD